MRNILAMNDTASTQPASATERTYSGVAISERAAYRRQRFIDAGIILFGNEGFQATTIRKLTAQTGLTNRYFYESFQDMEDLLIACYETLMSDFREQLQAELDTASESPEKRIRAGLTCFFNAMSKPEFARITHSEVLGVSPRVEAVYSRYTADFAELLMGYLSPTGTSVSTSDNTQREYVGAALAGAVINAGIVWVRSRYAVSLEEIVDATLTVFLGTANLLQR
ncbi:TetR/AcrR family transcriptional regulator [Alteromonas sp. H39]|uniref:TetR/AcrR family transcriptional regulator n=1 Tax=Alteromonas sp. H39 TaxID=3389876 RepID=UPI0039DF9208